MDMAGSLQSWTGGATAHMATAMGELGPARQAQLKEFHKAKNRLATGNYRDEKRTAQEAAGSAQAAAQAGAQQSADLARQRAAGLVSSGQSTENQKAVAQAQQAAVAQGAAVAQQNANNRAMQQYLLDQKRVDDEQARWVAMNDKQADISMQTTGASQGGKEGGDWYQNVQPKQYTDEEKAALNKTK